MTKDISRATALGVALLMNQAAAGIVDGLLGGGSSISEGSEGSEGGDSISPNVRKFQLNVTEIQTSLDGGDVRSMFALNGRPFNGADAIVIDEGDVVEIEYINSASTNSTMHAHGITQQGSMYSDGVPGVSQHPIQPGQNFTYTWQANEYGLYWLHDHVREEYQDGKAMPLYIRPKEDRQTPFHSFTNDSNALQSLTKQDRDPQIITLADYTTLNGTAQKTMSEEWHSELLCYDSILINNHGRKNCPSMDKLKSYADANSNALIAADFITAKGCPDIKQSTPAVPENVTLDADIWYDCTETNTTLPRFEFEWTSDGSDGSEQWGVLQMVSAASHWSYIVSIDEHPVYIYAQDGHYHTMPTSAPADAFEMVIGERLAVAFKLHTPGEYAVRVAVLNAPQILAAHATIKYGDAETVFVKEEGLPPLPASIPSINYGGGVVKENATVVESTQLLAYDAPAVPKPHQKADHTLIFTLQYDGTLYWGMSDNGAYVEQYDMAKQNAETPALFDMQGYLDASSTAHYPAHSVVDVVFITNGTTPQPPHPMHFHGLHRHLLATGTLTGDWNYTDVADFDAKHPDTINWINPAYIDTFNTPTSMPDAPSYLITRFQAGDAEPTLLHCHIGSHKAQGMEYLLIAQGEQPDIPTYYHKKAAGEL
ncbi:hypothetical protein E3P99_04123 [Wallemia hederae]|uniref:Plastocyanin-like domain-containing protein n=1 Tax=Wallemia hederae TaxID=1540922 RepID=A0A4T0FC64_9BASI|nr:hypothetical protein E3P99_04123 [Wallemia hederae]